MLQQILVKWPTLKFNDKDRRIGKQTDWLADMEANRLFL